MASWPGPTLEDFLGDAYFTPVTPELVAQYEPHREAIERALEEFDPETQSWRDYRNALDELYGPPGASGTETRE